MDAQQLSRPRGLRPNRLDNLQGRLSPAAPRSSEAQAQGRGPTAFAGRAPPLVRAEGEETPAYSPPAHFIHKMQGGKKGGKTSLTDVSGHCGQSPGELLGSHVFFYPK